MKKVYFLTLLLAVHVATATDSVIGQAKQFLVNAYEYVVGPSMAQQFEAIKVRYLKNQKVELFTQKRTVPEIMALLHTMRPTKMFCHYESKKITAYVQCEYGEKYELSPKGKQKLKTLKGQNELLSVIKRLYLTNIIHINEDIEFWHAVLKAMGKNQSTTDTLVYIRQLLAKNDPAEIEQLLNTAIQNAKTFYANKPYIEYSFDTSDEVATLKYLLRDYAKNKEKKITLKDIKIGSTKWFQGSDDNASNWTNSRYFWFVVLREMGYKSVTLKNTWETVENILKEKDRKTVYTLLNTAMKKIYSLEKIAAYASPAAWWESIKATYSDTFN